MTDKQALASAFSGCDAIDLESRASRSGLPLSALRTFEQWDLHPQASVVSTMPIVAIERIGDAPPRALPVGATRPLSGVRVLELARIIADAGKRNVRDCYAPLRGGPRVAPC
jgi:hypothetical protein